MARLPFPLGWRGVALVASQSADTPDIALAKIEEAIRKARPRWIRRENGVVKFRGGFRLVSGSNILVPLTSGTVSAAERAEGLVIIYQISFVELALIVTGLVALFLLGPDPTVPLGSTTNPLAERLTTASLAWLWLYGGNFVIAIWRFPRFLRKAASAS